MGARRLVGLTVVAMLCAGAPAAKAVRLAPVDDYLAARLASSADSAPVQVFVHGVDLRAGEAAAARSGLRILGRFERIGAVLAIGSADQVRAARARRGVAFIEGDRPVRFGLDSTHLATNGEAARRGTRQTSGSDGTGVSVAVIDTGIDGTHPFFLDPEGVSKVVRNVRTICPAVGNIVYNAVCFVDEAVRNDSDLLGLGGHGTHVAGIVAGYDVKTTRPRALDLHGAAPGASLVGVSVGVGPSMGSGVQGLNWVLANHADPCGSKRCPPIRVVNNSWGPVGGSSFCPDCAATKMQRQLVDEGVVVVWAAGNDGGDGSGKNSLGVNQDTSGYGKDPTPGVLMVASYDDKGTGTRDGALSSFSSRGIKGRPDTYPDISAPGSRVLSSCRPHLPLCDYFLGYDGPGPDDVFTFTEMSGTSMAAPHIAGIIAQLFRANPAATPAQAEWALVTTAYKFGSEYQGSRWGATTSFDKGHGLVDAAAAVRAISSRHLPANDVLAPPPPNEPDDPEPPDAEPHTDVLDSRRRAPVSTRAPAAAVRAG